MNSHPIPAGLPATDLLTHFFQEGQVDNLLHHIGQSHQKPLPAIEAVENKYTRKMQRLVKKIMHHEAVNISFENDKIFISYPPQGKKYDLFKWLKYANLTQIKFSATENELYKKNFYETDAFFKPQTTNLVTCKTKGAIEGLLASFKNNKGHDPELSESQQLSLNLYSTQDFYSPANALLRGSWQALKKSLLQQGADENDFPYLIKELMTGIAMASSCYAQLPQEQVNSFRGEDGIPEPVLTKRLKAIKKGWVTRESGFTSTEESKPNPMFYSASSSSSVGILYVGFKGINIQAYSCMAKEKEILLLPGQFVKWDVIKTKDKPYLFIARPAATKKGLSKKLFKAFSFDKKPMMNFSFNQLINKIQSFYYKKEVAPCQTVEELVDLLSDKLQALLNHYSGKSNTSKTKDIIQNNITSALLLINPVGRALTGQDLKTMYYTLLVVDKELKKERHERDIFHAHFTSSKFWEHTLSAINKLILDNEGLLKASKEILKEKNPAQNPPETIQDEEGDDANSPHTGRLSQ
ncbi:MAG: hypothetical protein JO149_08365 [Gammaproteobacteria bacterium]|nr:hypothetical protein [Gammaproteobacteria bacterium]